MGVDLNRGKKSFPQELEPKNAGQALLVYLLGFRLTPLLAATMGGHTEAAKLLINTGAVDLNEGNLLNVAAEDGHTEIVKALLDTNKVDLNKSSNIWDRKPSHSAVSNGHTEIVKALLK